MPRSSAIRAILRQSGQVACQRSGTNVAVRAEEQFAPNRPIFKVLLLYISMRWDIDPGSVGEAMAAFCTASGSQSSRSVRFCAKARPLSMTAWPRDRQLNRLFSATDKLCRFSLGIRIIESEALTCFAVARLSSWGGNE